MADITLLPAPDGGWHWNLQEVNVGGQVFVAAVQQRDPTPPPIYEVIYGHLDYSHLVWVITTGLIVWNRVKRNLDKVKEVAQAVEDASSG